MEEEIETREIKNERKGGNIFVEESKPEKTKAKILQVSIYNN